MTIAQKKILRVLYIIILIVIPWCLGISEIITWIMKII